MGLTCSNTQIYERDNSKLMIRPFENLELSYIIIATYIRYSVSLMYGAQKYTCSNACLSVL